MKQRGPLYRLVLLAAAALLFAIGYYWGGTHKPAPVLEVSAVQLGTPIDLELTGLATIDKEAFNPATFGEHWALLTLVPSESAAADSIDLLTRVRNRLADRSDIQAAIRLVLIQPFDIPSIDPDSVPTDAGFVVLTADQARFEDLSQTLGTDDEESTGLWLVNPATQAVALFTASQDAATIAADIRQFVDHY